MVSNVHILWGHSFQIRHSGQPCASGQFVQVGTASSSTQASPKMSAAALIFRMGVPVTSEPTGSCVFSVCHVRLGICPQYHPVLLWGSMLMWHPWVFVTVVTNPLCSLSCNLHPDQRIVQFYGINPHLFHVFFLYKGIALSEVSNFFLGFEFFHYFPSNFHKVRLG